MTDVVPKSEEINVNFDNLDSMSAALKANAKLKEKMDIITSNYQTVDVSIAMNALGNVADVLKLAYAGSKGFPCSENTIEILGKYQSMVSNSAQTSLKFIDSCLTGLKNHRFALMMALKDKVDSSLQFIIRSSDIATEMVSEADKMVKQADDLVNLSLDALKAANKDESVSTAQQKEITDMINKAKADQAQYAQEIQSLAATIQELKEKEIEVAKKADTERQRQFIKDLVSGIMGSLNGIIGKGLDAYTSGKEPHPKAAAAEDEPTGDGGDDGGSGGDSGGSGGDSGGGSSGGSGGDSGGSGGGSGGSGGGSGGSGGGSGGSGGDGAAALDELEQKITAQRMRLQEKQIEVNGQIAKIGELLKGLNAQSNDLQAAIASLQLAIIALGKVKTTFELTKQFWTGVESQCKALSEIKDLQDLASDFDDFKQEYIQEVQKSALSWLSLGQINTTAYTTIMAAQQKTNDIMSNLPTKEQAVSIIKNESDLILSALQGDKSPALNN